MGTSKNVFASLVAAGKCDNVWSICMHEGKTSNGTLTVGGVDTRFVAEGKQVDLIFLFYSHFFALIFQLLFMLFIIVWIKNYLP